MMQHKDISRRYLMSVYGLVGWRDSNLAFTVRYCRNVTDNEVTCYNGVTDS